MRGGVLIKKITVVLMSLLFSQLVFANAHVDCHGSDQNAKEKAIATKQIEDVFGERAPQSDEDSSAIDSDDEEG